MKIRIVDKNGDMQFGQSLNNFLSDHPRVVSQLLDSRLKLWTGEWFFDTSDGIPWATNVLGEHTANIYDAVIRERILDTQGVSHIENYQSLLNNRKLNVNAIVQTIYGRTSINYGET